MTNATRMALVALYPTLHKTARSVAAARLSLEILHLNWEAMMQMYTQLSTPAEQKAGIKEFLLEILQKDIGLLIISNCCVQALDFELAPNSEKGMVYNDAPVERNYGNTVAEITACIAEDILPEILVRLEIIRRRY